MLAPYTLLDRKSDLSRHDIRLADKAFGREPVFIAGPCAVDPEDRSLLLETAHAIKEAGATALRGGVWKPRTSPYAYQGDSRALDYLLEARERYDMPICTEVMDNEELAICLDARVDILQIGTRNALNYNLLREIGRRSAGSDALVLLKRGRHMAPVDEFILAGEHIAAGGNTNVLLCPRGTLPTVEGYRSYPDESIIPLVKEKTWAPVVVDPSHAVGHAKYVPRAALAAFMYGADGLLVEAHAVPNNGICDDPKQAITPQVLQQLIADAREVFRLAQSYAGLAQA